MNANRIILGTWSNPESERLFRSKWPLEPDVFELYDSGRQCGGCAFYAVFNSDYGLCCHPQSRHHLETVFEHFTCAVVEGGGDESCRTFRVEKSP